jgi:hypothetical protein
MTFIPIVTLVVHTPSIFSIRISLIKKNCSTGHQFDSAASLLILIAALSYEISAKNDRGIMESSAYLFSANIEAKNTKYNTYLVISLLQHTVYACCINVSH